MINIRWHISCDLNTCYTSSGWGPRDFSVDDCVRNWIDGEYFEVVLVSMWQQSIIYRMNDSSNITDTYTCVSGGGSREKINLGLSFYGRSFAGATGLNQTHSGADKGNWGMDEGTPQYCKLLCCIFFTCLYQYSILSRMCSCSLDGYCFVHEQTTLWPSYPVWLAWEMI